MRCLRRFPATAVLWLVGGSLLGFQHPLSAQDPYYTPQPPSPPGPMETAIPPVPPQITEGQEFIIPDSGPGMPPSQGMPPVVYEGDPFYAPLPPNVQQSISHPGICVPAMNLNDLTPNMFGGSFGGSCGTSGSIIVPTPASLTGNTVTTTFVYPDFFPSGPTNSTGPVTFDTFPTFNGSFGLPALNIQSAEQVFFLMPDAMTPGEFGPAPNPITLLEPAGATAALQPQFQAAFGGPNATVGPVVYQGGTGVLTNGADPFDINTTTYTLTLDFASQVMVFNPAVGAIVLCSCNPGSGGNVGNPRISDDNNPRPRDRVNFQYDYFNDAKLGLGGYDVSRFTPSVEKTFLNGCASLELRVPFAATLDSNLFTNDLSARTGELGNVKLILKGLLYGNEQVDFSAGFGVNFPTADDTQVSFADGTELVRVENESWVVEPFLAFAWRPMPMFFAQGWAQYSYDANESPVLANPTLTGLQQIGFVEANSHYSLDGQIGFWMYGNPTGFISGIAPFAEIHHTGGIDDSDALVAGNIIVGNFESVEETNVTVGTTILIENCISSSVGAVFPLNDEEFYDWQIGARVNYYFGQTRVNRFHALGLPATGY
ncbi:Hypothetical protein PBC10988_19860 [Planctomycetales bacterium 10988]|nr:Hypothetical protein PBC10988_19860 [Planctomycetales bacterium 10988]